MKACALLLVVSAGLLLAGCQDGNRARPAGGGMATNTAAGAVPAASHPAGQAGPASTQAAAVHTNSAGAATTPQGTFFGHGTGTGSHSALFWFYSGLGVLFLAWLILAIRHRVGRRHAQQRHRGGSR